jgi:hypothetical protein
MSLINWVVQGDTFIYGDTDVVWDVPFSRIDDMFDGV